MAVQPSLHPAIDEIDDQRQVQITSLIDALSDTEVADVVTEWRITTSSGTRLHSGTQSSTNVRFKENTQTSVDLNGTHVRLIFGSQPTLAQDRIRAIGFKFNSLAFDSLMSKLIAAPSTIPEADAAVTKPSFLNKALSVEIFS